MFRHLDFYDFNLIKHLRDSKNTDPDAGAQELCDLLNQYLDTLKDRNRKFLFFDEKRECTLGQDAMFTSRLLDKVGEQKVSSSMQKLVAAFNNPIVLSLIEIESNVFSILQDFFTFFPENLRQLPVKLRKLMFPQPINQKKLLSDFILDEKKSQAKPKSRIKAHLTRQVILDYQFERLLQQLDEDYYAYSGDECEDEMNTPRKNFARKLIVSSAEDRNDMVNKLIDVMIQELSTIIQNTVNADDEKCSLEFCISHRLEHILNIIHETDESISLSLQVSARYFQAAWQLIEHRPLNPQVVGLVGAMLEPFRGTQETSRFAVYAMNFLSSGPLQQDKIDHHYMQILQSTVTSLGANELDLAVTLFNNYTQTRIPDVNTTAYMGLARVAICEAPCDTLLGDYQERRNNIFHTFYLALSHKTVNFNLDKVLPFLFPFLTVHEERAFAEKLRIWPAQPNEVNEILEKLREAALEKIRKQELQKLLNDELFNSTPFSRSLCSMVSSYAI